MWKLGSLIINFITILLLSSSVFSESMPQDWFRRIEGSIQDASNSNNEEGVLAWGESDRVYSFLRMYKATNNLAYLNECIKRIDNILLQRDNIRGVTSYIDKYGNEITLHTWRSLKYSIYCDINGDYGPPNTKYKAYNDPKLFPDYSYDSSISLDKFAYPYIVHTGMILLPIVDCILTIDENGVGDAVYSCNTIYKDIRDTFLTAVIETINDHEFQWVEEGNIGFYEFNNETPWTLKPNNTNKGTKLPLNMQNRMGSVFVLLSQIQEGLTTEDRKKYRDRAKKLAENFKKSLYIDNYNTYLWTYWGTPYSDFGNGEDISHAFLSLQFATLAYNASIAFNYEEMLKFSRTFVEHIFLGDTIGNDGVNDFSFNIDGSGTINSYRKQGLNWIILCQFIPDIYDICYNIIEYFKSNISYYIGISHLILYETNGLYNPSKTPGDVLFTGVSNLNGSVSLYISESATWIGNIIHENKNNFIITAMTSGDFNDDGIDEIVTAIKNSYGETSIYRSETGKSVFNTCIYGPRYYWTVAALTAGDFDNDGDDELVTGMQSNMGKSLIYISEASTLIGSCIYTSDTNFTIKALSTGDIDGNGKDELYTGLESPDGSAYIYKSETDFSIGSCIYGPNRKFSIKALTTGDFDGNGKDELIMGLEGSDGGDYIYKIETESKLETCIYDLGKKLTIKSLTAGDFDGNSKDELITGLEGSDGKSSIYKSETGSSIGQLIYNSNNSCRVMALASADFSASFLKTDFQDEKKNKSNLPSAKINFNIPNSGFVTLKLFNIQGKKIETILNKYMEKGTFEISLNKNRLPSGFYIYRLQIGKYTETKKILLKK